MGGWFWPFLFKGDTIQPHPPSARVLEIGEEPQMVKAEVEAKSTETVGTITLFSFALFFFHPLDFKLKTFLLHLHSISFYLLLLFKPLLSCCISHSISLSRASIICFFLSLFPFKCYNTKHLLSKFNKTCPMTIQLNFNFLCKNVIYQKLNLLWAMFVTAGNTIEIKIH